MHDIILTGLLSLAIIQFNPTVGNIGKNIQRMVSDVIYARDILCADIAIFPELCISGYHPQDMLLEPLFCKEIDLAIKLLAKISDIHIIFGAPRQHVMGEDKYIQNQALVIYNGEIKACYAKNNLINKFNFDERKYFLPGRDSVVFNCNGVNIGFLIGDDINNNKLINAYKNQQTDLLISLNAPVFHTLDTKHLVDRATQVSKQIEIPIIFSCLAGAQDELIFTGGSFAIDATGTLVAQNAYLKEQKSLITFQKENKYIDGEIKDNNPDIDSTSMLYLSLVISLRDYVTKNNFKKVVLGLSGGIDSAVTAAIAVDALGKENVIVIMMPFKHTTDTSVLDAEALSENLGLNLDTIPIYDIYNVVTNNVSNSFNLIEEGITTENIQARSRALILMTVANHTNSLVLNTGNKSEVAVGYFTLYGDSIGGFSVLSDVFKTQVYELAEYRNKMHKVIPSSIIERQPTAELAYKQTDQDKLPPYCVLDKIINSYLSNNNIDDIVEQAGSDIKEVQTILNLINKYEFKRKQLPIGPKISIFNFTDKHKYPITNNWKY